MKAIALLASAALLGGCFGYTPSSKRWAYVGDTILVLGGAGAIAADVTSKAEPCSGTGCPTYTAPVGGAMVAGVLLVTAGLVGMIFNATRTEAKPR